MGHEYLEMISRLEPMVRQIADAMIIPRFESKEFAEQVKLDGSVLTEVDKQVQDKIGKELSQVWPDISFLGEEMSAERQQELLQNKSVWCLDPIDGTSNFAAGIPFFGVSLALIEKGQSRLGLIYDPIRKECFTAVQGKGCWLNGNKLPAFKKAGGVALKEMIAVVDLKRLLKPESKKLLQAICDKHPYRSQRNFGSCALEWCWLAAGRIQIYIHGGQKLWDYAAGLLILNEAGGVASTIKGEIIAPQDLVPQSVVGGYNNSAYQTWYEWIQAQE